MSFLGNFISKAATTVNTLSPAKRWLALALLVLLAFSLVVLCKPSATQYVNLYQGRRFSSAELAQIEQAFANAGLNEWQIQDSQVTVPHPQKSSYLKALENVIESDTLNVDMDVALKNSSLWEPRHVKDLKIKHAKEKQLARMLASMKFIEDVTVRIDEIETKGLRGGRKTTALAAVKPTDDQQLDRHRAYAIRNAVAACYASLDLEQVTVLDLNSGRVFGRQQTANSEAEDPYTVRKRHFEQLFQDRIREELSAEIPGVSVEIHVALNYANQSATAPVATSVTSQSTATENNPSNRKANVAEPKTDQATIATLTENPTPASKLVPQHVVASITVPANYFREVQRRQDVAAANHVKTASHSQPLQQVEQTITQTIRNRVTQVLRIPTSPNLKPPTTIVRVQAATDTSVVVADSSDTQTTDLPQARHRWAWLGWIMFAVVGTGILLHWMQRKTATTNRPQLKKSQPTSAEHAVEAISSEPTNASSSTESTSETSEQLRFKLTDRIRQNPEDAVHVLQDWLSDTT